jgi:hypothetical protein
MLQFPRHLANLSVSIKIWRVKKRISGLRVHRDAVKTEYWKGYQDALDHAVLILNRMEYEERRKIAENKGLLNK